MALATGAAYNGVDVYSRNFLFGSDNIEAVHALTVTALRAHEDAAFPKTNETRWVWEDAVKFINAHQALCGPAAIRASVLEAIKTGTATAYASSGTAFSTTLETPTQAANSATSAAMPTATAAGKIAAPSVDAADPNAASAAAAAAQAAAVPAAVDAHATGADPTAIVKAATDKGNTAALDVVGKIPNVTDAEKKAFAAAIVKPIGHAAAAAVIAPAITYNGRAPADHNSTIRINQ